MPPPTGFSPKPFHKTVFDELPKDVGNEKAFMPLQVFQALEKS